MKTLLFILWIAHVSSICLPKKVVEGQMTVNDQTYPDLMHKCTGLKKKECENICEWVDFWESGLGWAVNKKESEFYMEYMKEQKINHWEIAEDWKSPWNYPKAKKGKGYFHPSKAKQWAQLTEEQQQHVLKYDSYPPIAFPSIEAEKQLKAKVKQMKSKPFKLEELFMNEGFIELTFKNTYKDPQKKEEITKTEEIITVYDVDQRSIPNAVATSTLIDKEEVLLSMDYDVKQQKLWKLSQQNQGSQQQNPSEDQPNQNDVSSLSKKSPQSQQKQSPQLPQKHETVRKKQTETIKQPQHVETKTLQKKHTKTVQQSQPEIELRKRRLLDTIGAVPSRRRLLFGRDIRLPVRDGTGAGFRNDHHHYTGVVDYPVDNTQDPFRSVGALHIWDGHKWKPHCTAWHLTQRILVTNGHCIVNIIGHGNRNANYRWFPLRTMRYRPGWTGTAATFDPLPPIYADINAWTNDVQTMGGTAFGIEGPGRWYVGNGMNANDRVVSGQNQFDGRDFNTWANALPHTSVRVDQGNGDGVGNDHEPTAQCNYGVPSNTPQNCRRYNLFGTRPDDIETVWIAKGWMEPVPGGWTRDHRGRLTNAGPEYLNVRANAGTHVYDFVIIKLRNDRAISLVDHPMFFLSRVTRAAMHAATASAQHYTAPALVATGLGGGDANTYTGLFTSGYPGVWAYNQMTNKFDGSGGGNHGFYVHDRNVANRLFQMHDALKSGASGSPYIQLGGNHRRVFGLHADGGAPNGGARGLEIDQARYNAICSKVVLDSIALGLISCPIPMVGGSVIGGVHQHNPARQSEQNVYEYDEYDEDEEDDEEDDEAEDEGEDKVGVVNYYSYYYPTSYNGFMLIFAFIAFTCGFVALCAAIGIICGYSLKDVCDFSKKIEM